MDCLCYLCLVFVVFSRLFVTAGGGGGCDWPLGSCL